MALATTSNADLHAAVRRALSDMANDRRSEANVHGFAGELVAARSGSSPGSGAAMPREGAADERYQLLRERIATLEDVLVKSEADRSAVYAQYAAVVEQLEAERAENTAMLHGMHEATHTQPVDTAEVEALRTEVRALRDDLVASQDQCNMAVARAGELEHTVKSLKKEKKKLLAQTDGVNLADLHFSNERLSAQLAQLQSAQAQREEQSARNAKLGDVEAALAAITDELTAAERRLAVVQANHEQERQRLHNALDKQFQEFSIERAECDTVVGIMGAKIEALTNEVASLKAQLAVQPARKRPA